MPTYTRVESNSRQNSENAPNAPNIEEEKAQPNSPNRNSSVEESKIASRTNGIPPSIPLSEAPSPDTEECQIIDVDFKFYRDRVRNIYQGNLYTKKVISIIGPQSSGKSSLLNQLFGVNFPVLSGQEGYQRQTCGICLKNTPDYLILDVEGSDSDSRRDDRSTTRRLALFAMAVSDIMLVNLKASDSVRDQGSVDELLEMIIARYKEMCFKEFPIHIIFVLRDYRKNDNRTRTETNLYRKCQDIFERLDIPEKDLNQLFKLNYAGFAFPDNETDLLNSAEVSKLNDEIRKLTINYPSQLFEGETLDGMWDIFYEIIRDDSFLDVSSEYEKKCLISIVKGIKELLHNEREKIRTMSIPKALYYITQNYIQDVKNIAREIKEYAEKFPKSRANIKFENMYNQLINTIEESSGESKDMILKWILKANKLLSYFIPEEISKYILIVLALILMAAIGYLNR